MDFEPDDRFKFHIGFQYRNGFGGHFTLTWKVLNLSEAEQGQKYASASHVIITRRCETPIFWQETSQKDIVINFQFCTIVLK